MRRALFPLFLFALATAALLLSIKTSPALEADVTGLCFSPNGGCTRLVVNRIDNASRSIKVMAYAFTSAPISTALIRAKNRGVNVQVVIDHDEAERGSYGLRMLLEQGIPVYSDTEAGIFHDKVMIIDGGTVITGSMNWTKSGEHFNAENLIVLKSGKLAAYYLKNFRQHESSSTRVQLKAHARRSWFSRW